VKQKFALHHYFGLRAVAIFEFIKGSAVLLIGMGLLSLVHHDVQEAVERLMKTLHFDPAWHWCKFLLNDASTMTDVKLRRLAVLAFAYSAFRIIEAYGLWFEYLWAEWLAVISATIYLPVEVRHLVRHATLAGACVLVANLLIVAYLAYVLWDNHRARVAAKLAKAAKSPSQPATETQ
jgi:uncharacterized membrane protein (DUF2068 family)